MADKPEVIIPIWAKPEVLFGFIDELRDAGYNIGVSHYAVAQDLILFLISRREALNDSTRLKRLLGPVLCSSPGEQDSFSEYFDRWEARHSSALSRPDPSQKRGEQDQNGGLVSLESELQTIERKGGWLRVGLWVIALLCLGMLGFFALNNNQSVSAVSGAGTSAQSILPSKERPQSVEPRSRQATGVRQGGLRSPTVSRPKVTRMPAVFRPSAALMMGVIVFLSGLLAWRWWWYRQASLFLVRHATSEVPQIERISVDPLIGDLFGSMSLLSVADDFRRRVEVPSEELDLAATVESTVRQYGWFTPIFGTKRVMPEYLILIDRASRRDQQVRLIDGLLERLEQGNVFVSKFYFDTDPRICFPSAGNATPLTLQDLYSAFSHHRLLIFSDGLGLLSSSVGGLDVWVDQLLRWEDRVILTPQSSACWGHREWVLSQSFVVLPATVEGLAGLTQALQAGRFSSEFLGEVPEAPLPEELQLRPLLWLSRNSPESWLIEEVLSQVELFLGDNGYYWLKACAVYPALDWNLTLYLGNALRTEDGQTLLNLPRASAIAQLPWLRYGHMPDWLRQRLLSTLKPEQEEKVRAVLASLFLTVLKGGTNGFELEIAEQHGRSVERLFKAVWYKLAKKTPGNALLKDYVFRNFMAGRRPQHGLAVRLPSAVSGWLSDSSSDIAPTLRRAQRLTRAFVYSAPVLFLIFLGLRFWDQVAMAAAGVMVEVVGTSLFFVGLSWKVPKLKGVGLFYVAAVLFLAFADSFLLAVAVLLAAVLAKLWKCPGLVLIPRSERLKVARVVFLTSSTLSIAAVFLVVFLTGAQGRDDVLGFFLCLALIPVLGVTMFSFFYIEGGLGLFLAGMPHLVILSASVLLLIDPKSSLPLVCIVLSILFTLPFNYLAWSESIFGSDHNYSEIFASPRRWRAKSVP